ncbi:MAG: aminotransferase class I/II-fold pyridoxal phosphate-dependent enzyme [Myxococcales bacterium]|nr:aminotransferase class I/II-fold pyridoxal phosphate-dependent enzyme [Myxococcales bacterium]
MSLSVGEPDYAPPPHVLAATVRGLSESAIGYTQVGGLHTLREAICADSARRRTVVHSPDQVVVSAGAKHALYNLSQVLLDPGDRVVIPAPSWGTYTEQVRLAGATPVRLDTSPVGGYFPTPAMLAQALSGPEPVKAVVLCVPSNPTGAVVDRATWCEFADVLRGAPDVVVIVDEIYAQLTYDGFVQASLLTVAPDLQDRVVIVDGVSKTYAMTGFRIGWVLAPTDVARSATALQGQVTTNVSTLSQWAAQAALTGDQSYVAEVRRVLQTKRDLLCDGLQGVPGLSLSLRPRAAFYAWVDVRGWLGARHAGGVLDDDVAVAHFLLDAVRLSVVPGSAFDAPGHIRLSFATAEGDIVEGIARLKQAAVRLSGLSATDHGPG